MTPDAFLFLTAEELRTFMARHRETDYLLIDVRQPSEYRQAHIPGSRLLPLNTLQTRIFDLPADRHLIFYCHSGGRSAYAADLAAEAEVTSQSIYNLEGGILAWDGHTLKDVPRIQAFDRNQGLTGLLMTAMNMEKGAFRFYVRAYEDNQAAPYAKTLKVLSEAETGHAKRIYQYLKTADAGPVRPFDTLFSELDGDILEGGKPLKEALDQLASPAGRKCLALFETAIAIEYAAYDLYRTMAEMATDDTEKETFFSLAQAEKGHMKTIAEALEAC